MTMTIEQARNAMLEANASIRTAIALLRPHLPLFEAFAAEQRNIESIGPIINPTLYRSSERRAVADAVGPIYEQACRLVETFDTKTGDLANRAVETVDG